MKEVMINQVTNHLRPNYPLESTLNIELFVEFTLSDFCLELITTYHLKLLQRKQ